MRAKRRKRRFWLLAFNITVILLLLGFVTIFWSMDKTVSSYKSEIETEKTPAQNDNLKEDEELVEELDENEPETIIKWNPEWKYAKESQIHEDDVILYRSDATSRKDKVIAVNAGHGTSGGSAKTTKSHPDGSPKVTGGSTSKGAIVSTAITEGMTFLDGTPEAMVNLKVARELKSALLKAGYDVLMIRDNEDTQLDNIARTVFANNNADCHIAIHFDSSDNDKGAFYIGVPEVESYRNMEPVASFWEEHQLLGENLIWGLRSNDVKIYGKGCMEVDLTQTSYSTIPSVDLELGDRQSDYSGEKINQLVEGIVRGLDRFY